MNQNRRFAILVLLLCPFSFGCFCCCGGFGVDQQKQSLEEGDRLYTNGDHAGAVAKYKSAYTSFWSKSEQKSRILPRIVDHEAKAGNLDEAKRWIERGLADNVKVEYSDPKAKELYAVAKKQHDEAEAKRKEDETRRQAEAKAEAAARRARENPVNVDKYNRVKTGMTYEQVRDVIGVDGEELSRVEIGGTTSAVFCWRNRDGSNMNVTFSDGRVVAKAQFGLR